MPVKIRLMRIGAKKRPFYRVVAVDEREKRTGKYLELLGTYNPLTEPKEVILKKERLDWWKNHGAVESDGFLRATGKAAPRPPRKPKKEHKEEAAPQTQPEALKPEQPVEEKPEKKLEAEPVKEQVAEESPAAEETPMENSESSQEASAEETKPESEENQN